MNSTFYRLANDPLALVKLRSSVTKLLTELPFPAVQSQVNGNIELRWPNDHGSGLLAIYTRKPEKPSAWDDDLLKLPSHLLNKANTPFIFVTSNDADLRLGRPLTVVAPSSSDELHSWLRTLLQLPKYAA